MKIKELELQNFRCFTKNSYKIRAPYVIIEGPNGSGKTSFLEALYYAGNLRSWKTALPKELIAFDTSSFFVRLLVHDSSHHGHLGLDDSGQGSYNLSDQDQSDLGQELTLGFSSQKRVVTLNQKPVRSFKDLFDVYRVVQITQDDVQIISGSPEHRRAFIDAALVINNTEYLRHLRRYSIILEQRNALLKQGQYGYLDTTQYWHWTEQLWHTGILIVQQRNAFLTALANNITHLKSMLFCDNNSINNGDSVLQTLTIQYEPKRNWDESFDEFKKNNETTLLHEEKRIGRSLFGAHLDDIGLYCTNKKARIFASRGQQKFIIMLIKIAQIQELLKQGNKAIIVIDDFITDFDEYKMATSIDLLKKLELQLFFTVPFAGDLQESSYNPEHKNSILLKMLGTNTQVISLQ